MIKQDSHFLKVAIVEDEMKLDCRYIILRAFLFFDAPGIKPKVSNAHMAMCSVANSPRSGMSALQGDST